MNSLARKLGTFDYFALAFGTMVGTGWLIVMDDWLRRGGPLGAILGFAIGGAALVPIGYVYGRLVMAMPDAASEIAYTGKVFSPSVSFATGWIMVLAYLPVCPWEAVAVGKIVAYIFPGPNSAPLYSVAGKPVYLPHLMIGLVRGRLIAIAGMTVGSTLVLMKVLPNVPGHFTVYEYAALALWCGLGFTLKRRIPKAAIDNRRQ